MKSFFWWIAKFQNVGKDDFTCSFGSEFSMCKFIDWTYEN